MSSLEDPGGSTRKITLRAPFPEDGEAVHRLIAACPPLDENSLYCNLLQCTDFSATSALAECDGAVTGFVSGYRKPEAPDVLFVWQVAVASDMRGLGLGKSLIRHILLRHGDALSRIETTITESNAASWGMFKSLAADLSADWSSRLHFDRQRHLGGGHDSEFLLTIGPFLHKAG